MVRDSTGIDFTKVDNRSIGAIFLRNQEKGGVPGRKGFLDDALLEKLVYRLLGNFLLIVRKGT